MMLGRSSGMLFRPGSKAYPVGAYRLSFRARISKQCTEFLPRCRMCPNVPGYPGTRVPGYRQSLNASVKIPTSSWSMIITTPVVDSGTWTYLK
eukprot:2939483-Rhodomonas_salina.1